MKKVFCIVGFLVLAAQLPLWGYDTSPSYWQIVPEAVWASATGGGTWVTEVQITNFGADPASITVYFDTSTAPGTGFVLPDIIPPLNSVKYSNILATIDALDSSALEYYGKVGAIWFTTGIVTVPIQVQAQTVNGNYGKTFPGLNVVEGNTAVLGRPMMIQGLVRNATYRTSVGVYNPTTTTYTVRFTIVDATNATVGVYFEKTLTTFLHLSFNPFVQAGITTGTYDNCWLYMEVTAEDYTAAGLLFYGSIANNYTNDTYALIAKQHGSGAPPPASAPPIRH
ncbi:MAG: hypothetical protein OEW05_07335 [Candidatus Aminicenantes bacterium]|nr:hypothetical protein [Candidatus Aminicenantes bacterium]